MNSCFGFIDKLTDQLLNGKWFQLVKAPDYRKHNLQLLDATDRHLKSSFNNAFLKNVASIESMRINFGKTC